MKTQSSFRNLIALTGSAMLIATTAQAAIITWDAGGAGGAITNGAGAWLGAGLWNNGGVAATWTSGDDAIFGGVATAGGAVTLASPTTANSLTFNSFTGTYTLGTAGQALTINNGITMNASAAAVTFVSPITLGGAQTWTNNSASTLQVNTTGVTNAGNQLTIDGTGTTSFGVINNAAVAISGSGNLVKNGSGLFSLGGTNTGFTGNTTVNGGVMRVNGVGSLGTGNLNLAGGVYEEYWTNTFTRTLGSGAGQIQITGGSSGFSENGATGMTVRLNNSAAFEAVWGSATFNPSTFVLQASTAQNGSSLTFDNKIDLNGADRTIAQNATGTATATIAQAIRTSTGTAGLIKTGVGTLALTASNTYNGGTTISAGILQANSTAALGDSSATNTLIFNGGTLRASATITSAATRSVTMNSTGIIDTNGQAISIAGNISGAGGLTKIGTGTLTLSGTNDYTGPTALTAGTLSIGAANHLGALSSNLVFSGGTLQITGTSLNSISSLGRTVVVDPGAVLALDISNAGNTFTFDTSLPQAGLALAGAGTVAFQNTVTSLTLNAKSGNTYTYSGVIADGATGMDLTTIGAGTQTLQGANTYTGDTFLNAGTLNLSGAAGSLTGTTGITFNGGGLTLTNTTGTQGAVNRVSNSVGITSNGGTLTYANSSVAAGVYLETIGSVALTSGQLNLVENTTMANGLQAQNNQTLALAGLTRTGASNTSAITFSALTTGLQTFGNRNMIRVNGINTDTAADQIIGAWATVGTAANSQTDYAVYDSDGTDGYVVARNTAGSAESTWSTSANAYTTSAGGTVTLTGTRTITALRNTGVSTVLTLATSNNLQTYGVLNGAATLLTIAPGTGGVLTTPTGGGNLYLTAHGINTDTQGAHTGISVTAPINNNGLDAVTLVKSGVGVLQLNATSNYSGGTVLNSGTLWAQTDASLGNVNGDITFNGSATLVLAPNNGTGAYSYSLPATRSIIVNDGAMATIAGGRANANVTINGDISGSGGVTVGKVALLSNGGIGSPYTFSLLGSNTFTGAFNVGTGAEAAGGGGSSWGVTINSLADSTSPITLNFGQSGSFFSLGSTATANLSVPNRPVDLLNSNMTIRNQDANNTMTLGSVSTTTTGAKTLNLGDGGFGGFISGNITDGTGSIAVSKSGTGDWSLSGTNTYTGGTTLTAGTLRLANTAALGAAGRSLALNGGILDLHTDTSVNAYNVTVGGNATIDSDRATVGDGIDNTFGTLRIGTFTLSIAESLGVNVNNNTAYGIAFGTTTLTGNATFNVANNGTGLGTLTLGAIGETGGARTLTKTGAGKLATSGASTYTGATTISAGTMEVTGSIASSSGITNNAALVFNSASAQSYGNAISGSGTLTKSGAGTLTLGGTNTYSGVTTVTQGKLVVNGSISTSTLTTVQTGATLGGSGTVGALTIDSGGTFSPGNSPGIETVNGNYIQNGTLVIETEGLLAGNGAGFHDQVIVNGIVTLNGLLDLTAFSGTYVENDLIFILLNDGVDAVNGIFTNIGYTQGANIGTFAGREWLISYNADSVGNTFTGGNDIALTAIPEPGVALLGGLSLLGLVLRRRR